MKTEKIIMLSLIVLPVIAGVSLFGNTTAQFSIFNAVILMLSVTEYRFLNKAFGKIIPAAAKRSLN